MVTTKLENDIVWITIEGPFLSEEIIPETDQWVSRKDEFIGYISDIRSMTDSSPVEQKKVAERRKQNNLRKPMAVLGKDSALASLIKIFIRFTSSENIRYFTDEQQAKDWIHSQN